MPLPSAPKPFENWLWIELLAFDNESPDFGVQVWLDRLGFLPDGLLLFMFSADFVNGHQGMAEAVTFPPHFCSYRGRPYNRDRQRQPWTNYQLRGLVAELRRRGIPVYASVMTLYLGHIYGKEVHGGWADDHPELMEMPRTGEGIPSINPLHRFNDGSFYEDFFIPQLLRTLDDYGFDGFHGADGYSSPRRPLSHIDYSDDMVGQFLSATGITLPPGIEAACEGRAEAMEQRADWIWTNHRLAWIGFYADRWTAFCSKLVTALHDRGKKLALNNAWTRDPLQALYRYGVDYQRLATAGVDTFVVETVAAGVSTGAESVEASPHYDYLAMLMLMKAYAPATAMRCLNGTRDGYEQWDVLEHARPVLEREIYSLSNLYLQGEARHLQRCSAGPVFCLATDVEADEWRWLQEKLELGFGGRPQGLLGAALVWSDRAFARELPDFIATRRCTTHKLLHELLSRDAPVYSAVRIENLAAAAGPLLVLNGHLFPADELQALLAYDRGPLVMIAAADSPLPPAPVQFTDLYPPGQLVCHIYGYNGTQRIEPEIEDEGEEVIPDDLLAIADPLLYPQELYFRQVSASFLGSCARALRVCSKAPEVLSGEGITVQAIDQGGGVYRLLVGNRSRYYVFARLDMKRPISDIRVLTRFPAVPVVAEGSQFTVRVPGSGMVVLEATAGTMGRER